MKTTGIGIVFLCAGLFATTAHAQDPVPDTLDWHGYFPLEVGNTWQYYGEKGSTFADLEEWYEKWHVVADSLIEGTPYFVLEVTCDSVYAHPTFPFSPSCVPGAVNHHVLRYDEEAANVVERIVTEENTVEEPFFFFDYDFRLDAAFYAEEASNTGRADSYFYDYAADLEVGDEQVETTVKSISVFSAIPGGFGFAHNIGMVNRGFNEGGGTSFELVYAQIGTDAYGQEVRLSLEPPERPTSAFHLSVYPNPLQDAATVAFRLGQPGAVELRVFDVLGRMVHHLETGYHPAGAHRAAIERGALSSGTYFVALVVEGEVVATRPLVVVP